MSILSYNGVTLPYAYTTSFTQEAVGDASNTDWMITRFDISVQSIINFSYINMLAADAVGVANANNPAAIMRLIYSRLMKRRKTLSFTINGYQVVPQAQTGNLGTVDARNGPIPQSCSVKQMGNTSFMVDYHIVAHYWENNPGLASAAIGPNGGVNNPGNNILSNRWGESQGINSRNFSTKSRSGTYTIRSDNQAGKIVDQFRSSMAQLSVPAGFLRTGANYSVSEDGLSLSYQITDTEVYKLPPWPALEAEGYYTESLASNGGKRFGEVNLTLRAGKGNGLGAVAGVAFAALGAGDQAKLVNVAVAIAYQKLALGGKIGKIDHSAIRVNMYDNEVNVSVRGMFNVRSNPLQSSAPGAAIGLGNSVINALGLRGGGGAVSLAAAKVNEGLSSMFMNWSNMVFTPGSDPIANNANFQIPNPLNYPVNGSAAILLQAAAYYDPSITATFVDPASGQFNQGNKQVGEAGKLVE